MKFGSDQAARRRVLEAGQQYRGMTFTDRGKLLLDVGSVQDGRVTLSQHGQSIRLLPETLSGIHRAWQDGDIPLDGKDDWECSTFSPAVSDADRGRLRLLLKGSAAHHQQDQPNRRLSHPRTA